MAGYTLNWQDFMKRPEVKVLLEEKGMVAVKQRYIQEQNMLMWQDPIILQEGQQDAGVVNQANAADGGSTNYITGDQAHVSTFTWSTTVLPSITASADGNFGITAYGIRPGVDYSYGQSNIRKKILLAFVTGSVLGDVGGLSTSGYDVVVTASYNDIPVALQTAKNVTGSWANVLRDNLVGQGAGAVVGGFTNDSAYAPSTLLSVATSSNGKTFTVTNAVKGDAYQSTTDIATSGSIATTTFGKSKWLYGETDGNLNTLDERSPYKHGPFASDSGEVNEN